MSKTLSRQIIETESKFGMGKLSAKKRLSIRKKRGYKGTDITVTEPNPYARPWSGALEPLAYMSSDN